MAPAREAQIADAEDRLRTAMLASDVSSLEELLAPDLIFTDHLGHLLGKDDDLAAYRSGKLKVKELKSSEQQIRIVGEVAVVSARVQLVGTYDGRTANGDFRFTRVWARSPKNTWRVIAAHAGKIL